MATDKQVLVTQVTPIDVASVRDPGMQSLVLLAASLDWNVAQKLNHPVTITSRDGTRKRLATNTSIRMGVFQSTLSTIMAHTDEDLIPTTDLMDKIIAKTKPSADHQRRLRLAVGESPAQHRDRVAAHEAESKGGREPEPLTQRIELPLAEGEGQPRNPVDEGEHGELVSLKPFMAVRQAHGETAYTYESDTSYERLFADGFVDYVCQACGKAYATPKGVGAHSQIHSRGPGKADPAWRRARDDGKALVKRGMPAVENVATEVATEPEALAVASYYDRGGDRNIDRDPYLVLSQIAALVAPELVTELEELRDEVINLRAERDALAKNLQALKELIGAL